MSAWILVGQGAWPDALTRALKAGGHTVQPLLAEAAEAGLKVGERVILALPAEALEATLKALAPHLQGNHRLVTLIRGLTPDGLRPGELVFSQTPVRQIAALAGAAGPEALLRDEPAALVVASAFPGWAAEIQAGLASETLRIYTENDHPGVELAAALAATLGVALGVARALKVGPATEATALTRALAEMDRLVIGLGGRAGTAHGLAGLGMLAELAFGGKGESFRAGTLLAKGKHTEATAAFPELAHLAQRLGQRAARQRLRAPLTEAVAALFLGALPAKDALAGLMGRTMRSEKS